MTRHYFYSLLLLSLALYSCAVVPKLDGSYTSTVEDNVLYFESEAYHFNDKRFKYTFSTDVVGDKKEGQGNFKQARFKTLFSFDKIPSRATTEAIITTSPPNPYTFELNINVKAGEMALPGAYIQVLKGTAGISTDTEGSAKLVLANDYIFPLGLKVSYLGYEPYVLHIEKPQNMMITVVLQPYVGHLITSVTQEKDIRKKGSYIYINGKKFKKLAP